MKLTRATLKYMGLKAADLADVVKYEVPDLASKAKEWAKDNGDFMKSTYTDDADGIISSPRLHQGLRAGNVAGILEGMDTPNFKTMQDYVNTLIRAKNQGQDLYDKGYITFSGTPTEQDLVNQNRESFLAFLDQSDDDLQKPLDEQMAKISNQFDQIVSSDNMADIADFALKEGFFYSPNMKKALEAIVNNTPYDPSENGPYGYLMSNLESALNYCVDKARLKTESPA